MAASAFSLKDGLARLLRPGPDEVGAVTGLRALSILWVLQQHLHQGLRPLLLLPEGRVFLAHPLLRVGWAGNLGVEIFFVISGWLIGGMLMREREETDRVALGRFWLRRAMRILPAYLLAIGATLAIGDPNARRAWANVLFVNDLLPFREQFMSHAWSLAIEEQFYLVFPLFVLVVWRARPAWRTPLLVATLAALALLAFALTERYGLFLTRRPDTDPEAFWRYMDLFYVRPYTRAGSLVVGVIVARLERTGVVARLDGRPVVALLIGVVALFVIGSVVFVFPEGLDDAGHRTLSGALGLSLGGYAFAAGVGALLAVARSRAAVGRALARVLGARLLHPIAQLSYAAYLFHPLCIALVLKLGFDVYRPWLSYPILLGLSFVTTFACAAVVHLGLELPIMKLRPPAR